MKMKPFAINTVIAVSLLASGTTLALATADEVCDKGAKQAAFPSPGRGEKPMQQIIDTLDLSPARQQQIQHIVAGQRGELHNKRQALREIRHKLYRAASGDDYDAAQVEQLIEQQATLAADLASQRADMMQKIYRQMTAQQQAEFQSMRHRYLRQRS